MDQVLVEIDALKREVKQLRIKCEQLESQNRRENLIFKGIPEKEHESWSDAEEALRSALKNNGIPNQMGLERVHRIGHRRGDGYPRPLICKFTSYKGREEVFSKKIRCDSKGQ